MKYFHLIIIKQGIRRNLTATAVIHPISKILLTPALCLSSLLAICQGHMNSSGSRSFGQHDISRQKFFPSSCAPASAISKLETALTAGSLYYGKQQARPSNLYRTQNMSTNQATAVRELYYRNITGIYLVNVEHCLAFLN